jgi:15-cis-phytoene synthase
MAADDGTSTLGYLRRLDYSAYLAALFAPSPHREPIATLYTFRAELAFIPSLVSDPLPGEIRLQWWKDVVMGERDGEAAGHPVASALLTVMKQHNLPRLTLAAMADARITDLYQDPMPDTKSLEAYLGETQSTVLQLALMITNADAARLAADASGHAGIAIGIADIIERMPWLMRRSLVLIPGDILAAVGTSSTAIMNDDQRARARALAAFVALGRDHAAKAKMEIAKLPTDMRFPFLLMASAERVFVKAEKLGAQSFAESVQLSSLAIGWDMLRQTLRNR